MGGNLFIILLLVSAVWQIVGSIAEKKAKQKQQEELARRRAEAQGSGRGGSSASTSSAGETTLLQSPPGADPRSRAEQIAARRKAQIDELRRRAAERAQGGSGAARSSTGRGTAPTPVSAGRADGRTVMADASRSSRSGRGAKAPAASRRPEIARDWDELTQRREAERASKAEGRRQQDLRDAAERRRKDVAQQQSRRSRKEADEAEAAFASGARSRSQAGIAAAGFGIGAAAGAARSTRLGALVRDREAMRDALMLHELLGPPMAFRSIIAPADANRDR